MVQASAAEAGLGDGEPAARLAQEVLGGHAAAGEAQVRVHTFPERFARESGAADHLHAWGTRRDDEHRGALVDRHVRVGDDHGDDEGSVRIVGGEPLLTVDHPLVAVAHRPAGEAAGVGAAGRFGHGEGGHDPSVEERFEEFLALFLGAVVGEDLGVAGVGGLGAEDHRGPGGTAQNLVQERQLDLPHAHAAEFGRQVGGPQTLFAHLTLERADGVEVDGAGAVVRFRVAREEDVERLDLIPYEGVGPVEAGLERGVGAEVPHMAVPFRATERRSDASRTIFSRLGTGFLMPLRSSLPIPSIRSGPLPPGSASAARHPPRPVRGRTTASAAARRRPRRMIVRPARTESAAPNSRAGPHEERTQAVHQDHNGVARVRHRGDGGSEDRPYARRESRVGGLPYDGGDAGDAAGPRRCHPWPVPSGA